MRTPVRSQRRRFAGFVAAATLSLTASAACANPLPHETWNELAALVRAFPDSASPRAAQRLSYLLRLSPGAAVVAGRNADVLESNFEVFKPYLLEAHQPSVPYAIARDLPELYLRVASSADRDTMLATLRSWLAVPSARGPAAVALEVPAEHDGPFPVRLEEQVTVAEILSDAGDTTALPLIRAFQGSIRKHSEEWVHLDQAALRMEDPALAGAVVPAEGGGLRVVRTDDGASVLVGGRIEVSSSVRSEIFEALRTAETHDRTALTRGGVLVRVSFPDGIVAKLTWSEGIRFIYEDNTRQEGQRHRRLGIQGEALARVLGEVLRANGIKHPLSS